MDDIILNRDSDGTIKMGDKTVKVPLGHTVLSILGVNSSEDCDVFEEDGWVYNKGKQVRPWLTVINSTRVKKYKTHTSNLASLEDLYHRACVWAQRSATAWWNNVERLALEGGKAHAKPTHKYKSNSDKNYWCYEADDTNDDGKIWLRWDWCNTPIEPILPELGQQIYESERRVAYCNTLAYKCRSVLEYVINTYLQKSLAGIPATTPKIVTLRINNRLYVYEAYDKHGNGWYHLKNIIWYDEKPIELNVAL